MRRLRIGVFTLALLTAGAWSGLAQGPTSGSINGTVTDKTGAVLPGVTVTVTSPAMMGVQAATTNDQGQYRFPSLTPGAYRVSYELAGFTTVVREGIVVNIGFSATINVQLAIASLQETVTVSGESPVVDIQNTNVQNNFTAEMLKSIPNARDIWSLIAEAPGMTVTRFDVGGSTAGTQTGFSAYGQSGQVRVQIDGVNTTEGTGAAGFYYDYGAFEEVQIGTDSNDASMPTPGVQLNAVLKSGGNRLSGDVYVDYENEGLQGKNVDDQLRRLGVGEGARITKYYDPNINVGGPIKRDRLWYFSSFRNQFIGTTVTGFPAEKPSNFEFATKLTNLTYKLTQQLSSNNKLSHYIQFGRKLQPHRGAGSTVYTDGVYKQDSFSYAGNVEWNSILGPRFFFNARFSSFGYIWPNLAYGVDLQVGENVRNRLSEVGTGNVAGGAWQDRYDRRRNQFDWTGTLFKDAWAGGDHSIKMGFLSEWENFHYIGEGYKDAVILSFNSPAGAPDFTRPYRVTVYNSPYVTVNSLWHHGAYVHDQIAVGSRLTINAGLRWDYYSAFFPDQAVRPGRFRDFFYAGAPLANGYQIPASYPSFTIPGRQGVVEYPKAFAPRLGVAYDLSGNGTTVVKANWGLYFNNPGTISSIVNPSNSSSLVFNWNDANADRLFTLNELGSFVSGGVTQQNTIDPNLKHPSTMDASVWLERQIVHNVSGRIGFVYRDRKDQYEDVELNRVYSLYTGTATGYDPGPDGIRGTSDDVGDFSVFDFPAGLTLPSSRTERRTPGAARLTSRSLDVTLNKRMSDRWSLLTSFLFTWNHNKDFAQTPNAERFAEYSTTDWAFKAFGTWRAPWGIVVSPVLRHQSGDNLSRIVQVTGLRLGTLSYRAEKPGSYRENNVTIFDTRVEKQFDLRGGRRLSAFFDAFNILNSNAAQSQDNVVGRRTTTVDGARVEYQRFLRPTVVIVPRVYRFGMRFSF